MNELARSLAHFVAEMQKVGVDPGFAIELVSPDDLLHVIDNLPQATLGRLSLKYHGVTFRWTPPAINRAAAFVDQEIGR